MNNPCQHIQIPFLGRAPAVFNDEKSGRWHTVDESRVYAWNEEDIQSRRRPTDGSGSAGLHAYCSLDEYCFPHLTKAALAERNNDQTFTRYYELLTKEQESATGKARHLVQHASGNEAGRMGKSIRPLLIVSQAFVWEIDDLLIIALPVSPPETFWRLLRHFRCYAAEEVIALLLYAIFDAFDPEPKTKEFLREPPSDLNNIHSIFKIFSRSIASALDQVSEYLKDKDVGNIDARQEHRYIHQILDIREEISMISSIITQQDEVWRSFVSNSWPSFFPDGPQGFTMLQYSKESDKFVTDQDDDLKLRGRRELFEQIAKPQHVFTRLKQRLQRLDDDAALVERSIEMRLDLRQKHASLQDAHASLKEAQKATLMSASVIGFTLITAIFTPLSFMVSLFALPIDRFQTNKIGSGDDAYYTTSYIGKWIGKF